MVYIKLVLSQGYPEMVKNIQEPSSSSKNFHLTLINMQNLSIKIR